MHIIVMYCGALLLVLAMLVGMLFYRSDSGCGPPLSEPEFVSLCQKEADHGFPQSADLSDALFRLMAEDVGEQGLALLYDLALTHPLHQVRFMAACKVCAVKSRSGKPTARFASEEVEPARRVRLEGVLAKLRQGDLPSSRQDYAVVACTLHDSWHHENVRLAIQAAGLYAGLEKERGISPASARSIFPRLLCEGLISECYPGSWSSRLTTMDQPGCEEERERVRALTEALSRFGPETAAFTVFRMKQALAKEGTPTRYAIPYEVQQVADVFRLLDGHAPAAAGELIRLLEQPGRDSINRGWITDAVETAARQDPKRVLELIEASSVDRGGHEYRRIVETARSCLGA